MTRVVERVGSVDESHAKRGTFNAVMTAHASRSRAFAAAGFVIAGALIIACGDASASRAESEGSGHATAGADTTPAVATFTVPEQCALMPPVAPGPAIATDSTRHDSVSPASQSTGDGAELASRADSVMRASDPPANSSADSARSRSSSIADSTPRTRARSRAARRTHAASRSSRAHDYHPGAREDSIARLAWGPGRVQATRAIRHALPGSLFPGCRVVAYYGNPLSRRMGILGELPPPQMLARLAQQAHAYALADTTRPVIPALELIATVAQAGPGKGGLYRLRMADTLIEKIARMAEEHHYIMILDVQTGRSTVAAEIAPLMKYLARPYVHLALDPEFAVSKSRVPGKVIGTMDAASVNVAVDALAHLVDSLHLPPKMLIVHRFTRPMLTNHEQIRLDPRVQIVIDMDGFGAPHLKHGSYERFVRERPVQFAGFKLFYKNDKPMLTPSQVLKLDPVPLFIMYQ